ncbi:MAG: nickel transporter permease [Candidatus Bipolaricaulota bacterium]
MIEAEKRRKSRFWATVHLFSKSKLALVGLFIVLVLIFVSAMAPWIAPHDPLKQDYMHMLEPPSRAYLLGTDNYGRDIFSRIIYGAKYALLLGVAIVTIQALIGVALGMLAGYYQKVVGTIIMRFTDIMLSIPAIVLALAIAGLLGGGLVNVIIAVGIVGWRGYTRLVRGEVLSIKEEFYVEAAKASGAGSYRIITRHLLPNISTSIIVYMSLSIPSAILWAAGLSFLGLGAQPPTPEWGAMLSDGRDYMREAWWMTTFPGLAIMMAVLAFNFLGDGLRDALDPKMAGRGV